MAFTPEDYLGVFMDRVMGVVDEARGEVDQMGIPRPPTGDTSGGGQAGTLGRVAPDDHNHGSSSGVTTGSLAWGGHENGRIPQDELVTVEGVHYQGGAPHRFEPKAASAFEQMRSAAAEDGVDIRLTDSYRDFDTQVSLRRRKGGQVATATPGTSIHGWGRAIDVANDEARTWIQRNGDRFGWVWPDWARKKGTKSFEPWHFEFRGGAQAEQAKSSEETISENNVRQALHGRT